MAHLIGSLESWPTTQDIDDFYCFYVQLIEQPLLCKLANACAGNADELALIQIRYARNYLRVALFRDGKFEATKNCFA